MPRQRRDQEAVALLRDLDVNRRIAQYHLVGQGQALQFAHGGVVAQQDAGGAHHRLQGGQDLGARPFHAGGGDLDHQQVAVAVHHQAGEAVAFAKDEPIEGLVVKLLAQGQGLADPLLPQGWPQGPAGIMGDQAGADQGVGIDVAVAEGMAAVAEDLDRLAGLEALERRRLGIDLVAVNPAMAGEQAAILVFVEAQGGWAGHVVSILGDGCALAWRRAWRWTGDGWAVGPGRLTDSRLRVGGGMGADRGAQAAVEDPSQREGIFLARWEPYSMLCFSMRYQEKKPIMTEIKIADTWLKRMPYSTKNKTRIC